MLMAWSQTLSVGVPFIDDEHKRLVEIANNLHDSMKQGQGQAQLGTSLEELADYTTYHFAHEESAMVRHGYPQLEEHRAVHKDLLKAVSDLQVRQKAGEVCLTVQVFEFLKNWLVTHIQGADKAFGDWLIAQGVDTKALATTAK